MTKLIDAILFWPCWLAAFFVFTCGCGLLGPSSPKVARFECQVRALEPLVGDVLDARKLLQDMYAGRASIDAVASSLKLTQAQIAEYNAAIDACEPPMPLPEGEAL